MPIKYSTIDGMDGVMYRAVDGSTAYIPPDKNNLLWVAYQDWIAKGNKPDAATLTPVAAPESVSRYQARAALLEAGLLDTVNAYFASLPANSMDRLAWDEAPTVHSNSEALIAAVTALGLKPERVVALFIRAAEF